MAPRVALIRWLSQIHYNAVRQIEAPFPNVITEDTKKPLRGFKIANGLVLTRKRTFYEIIGVQAVPVTIEHVSANYNLAAMQSAYREATETWKQLQRKRS